MQPIQQDDKSTQQEKPAFRTFATLCGRILYNTDSSYFPQAEYRGRKIFLCTNSCLGAFLADPEIFCKVHRKSSEKP